MTIIDDDEIEDEEEPTIEQDAEPEVIDDDSPVVPDEDTRTCDLCGQVFTGPMRNPSFGRHMRWKHPVEHAASKGAREIAPAKLPKAPKAPKQAKTDKPPRGAVASGMKDVHDNVALFYNAIGMIVTFKDDQCGPAIQKSAGDAADAWVELAKKNEKVKEFWSGGGGSTGWIELAMAHLPIVFAIQAHHINPMFERAAAKREQQWERFDSQDLNSEAEQPVVYANGYDTSPTTDLVNRTGAFAEDPLGGFGG